MKRSVFGCLGALLVAAGAVAGESRVARVVVYPDRAQVARVQTVACGVKAAAEFPELPPAIDLRSLRASAQGGTVEGIDVQQRTRESAFAPQAAELDRQLRKLEAQCEEQRHRQLRARLSVRQAGGYDAVTAQLLSREMALPGPDLKAWTLALEGVLGARQAATKAELDAGLQLRELQRKQAELREKRELLGASAQRRETFARVQVSCESGSAAVELTYVVGGASWTPFYEARADDTAGEGPLDLSMVATVSQRSGEDWTGARLVLSTAVPRQDATPPELVPLRVYSDPREPPKKVLVRRDEEQLHAQAGAARDAQTGAATDIAQQGLSVQLAVREPADVPGDGTATNLDVASTRLKSSFVWKVMPSQLPYVLRVADLVNAAPFPLLPGSVSLFRKGSFAGRTELARVAQGARFQLAFGLEENVKVKRLVLAELSKDTGFISKGRRFKFAYAFELTSTLGRAATVEVSDHVPVSELDDVQVSLGEKTTPGFAFDKEGGIVTWQAKLTPGEKQRLELHFAVDVPASYDSAGL
jgi:uncharacterized protein (TIGR02231 family)